MGVEFITQITDLDLILTTNC